MRLCNARSSLAELPTPNPQCTCDGQFGTSSVLRPLHDGEDHLVLLDGDLAGAELRKQQQCARGGEALEEVVPVQVVDLPRLEGLRAAFGELLTRVVGAISAMLPLLSLACGLGEKSEGYPPSTPKEVQGIDSLQNA